MKKTIEPETQGKHYEVDVRKIRPLQRAGGNPRTDYGDVKELADDIEVNGVVMPLRGFRVNDDSKFEWEITAGHRRLAACMLLAEKGIFVRVKMISIGDARKVTDEMILKDHITTNSGKEFTPVETAETLRRLQTVCGYKTKDLAALLGKSQRYVQNLLLLAGAPKRIRDMVSNKQISYTLVLDIFKQSIDFNDACSKIEASIGVAKSAPKKSGDESEEDSGDSGTKITKKHLNTAINKVDSFKELQMVLRANIDNAKTPNNSELYSFIKRIVENKLTRSQIEKELF